MRRHKQPEPAGHSLGVLILRGVVGSMFVAHGLQKLKGWFDGPGLKGTTLWFDSIGLQPGKKHAVAAGTTEAVGGALMLAGLATPVSSAMITGTMTVAIVTVNGKRGMWATNHGMEYNLVLLASVFAVASAGPGRYSLDRHLGTAVSGPAVGIGQLALGLAGGAAVLRSAGAGPWQQTRVGTDG
jgi:putative oxidoreductase